MLAVEGVTISFGGLVALADVSFQAKPASPFEASGLGLVGALAALGLAGALLRRRRP